MMKRIMKKLTLITLLFCAFSIKAQNLILNGSFEMNNSTDCYDVISSWIAGGTGIDYGVCFGNKVEIHRDSCVKCIPTIFWGGGHKKEIG